MGDQHSIDRAFVNPSIIKIMPTICGMNGSQGIVPGKLTIGAKVHRAKERITTRTHVYRGSHKGWDITTIADNSHLQLITGLPAGTFLGARPEAHSWIEFDLFADNLDDLHRQIDAIELTVDPDPWDIPQAA
jgi:hypothetical protein